MKSSRNLDEMLSSPWVLWVISVATAVALWFYVMKAENDDYVTRSFSCPLEYRSLDPQATLRNRVSEVDIEIRGPEADILRLDYNAVACFVDARSLAPGIRYTQDVRVNLPPNVTLVSCVPSQVVLDLVRQVVRLVPVEVVLPQDIPDGHYLEGVEVIPREVGIRGTERDIAKVGSLRAMPTAEELQSGKELLLPVKFAQSEPFDDTVVLEPPQVRVRGSLVRGLPRKRVPVNVRLSSQPQGDYEIGSVLTEPSEVQLEGPQEQLDRILAIDTETVDISLISTDQVVVAPLRLPDAEAISFTGASSVRLSLHLSEIKAVKRLAGVPILTRRGSGSRHWAVTPPSAAVTVEGRPSRIAAASPESIGLEAYVDLSNIFMTPIVLPVRAETVSDDFNVIKIEPATVTVTAADGPAGSAGPTGW